MLDNGSQATLVKEDLAKRLALTGAKQAVHVGSIKDKGEPLQVERVSFSISSTDRKCTFDVNNAYVMPRSKFNTPSQRIPTSFKTDPKYKYLHGLKLCNVSAKEVDLLIGADIPEALIATQVRRGPSGQPYAVETPFGWTLLGVADAGVKSARIQIDVNHMQIWKDDELHNRVEEFWQTEVFGTKYNLPNSFSPENERVLMNMDATTTIVNGHYEVGMLWKQSTVQLPNNYVMAERRFKSLMKRFNADQSLHQQYSETIESYVSRGYARRLTKEEKFVSSNKTWYLPHHAVINPNKKKVRVVFDAASSFKGVSLNDSLVTGPDFLNSLVGVLMRFRRNAVALVADIEAMFHQVFVKESDRDALRFLWRNDVQTEEEPDVYQMQVHIFGAKDSPSCATYALRKTALDNKGKFSNECIQNTLRNFYVDDLLASVKTEQEAIILAQEMMEMMKCGGFNLTKFISNSKKVMKALPKSALAKPDLDLSLDSLPTERALGVRWNIEMDAFVFSTVKREVPATKRGILKLVSSIFDPLGFLAPFIVQAKMLLQELWRKKHGWDDEIDEDMKTSWKTWLDALDSMGEFKVPRRYVNVEEVAEYQLHVFADASEHAFGAVACLLSIHLSGRRSCSFVMSKTRLAPLKTLTIARLELQAAVLAVRLYSTIEAESDIETSSTHFWTDSMITLQYIRNESRRLKTFVANRVAEIRENTKPSQWHHVDGKENPADDCSRGLQIFKITPDSRWLNGPAFLCHNETTWPEEQDECSLAEGDPEVKRDRILITTTDVYNKSPIEIYDFSTWKRLTRIMAWIVRACKMFRKQNTTKRRMTLNSLDPIEIDAAIKLLVRHVQQAAFSEEFQALRAETKTLKGRLESLSPFIDEEGLLRVGGRLKHAPISYSSRHQLILPAQHHLTTLLICHKHEQYAHAGSEFTLAEIRQSYWIVKGRSVVRKVIHECMHCKKERAKPAIPIMADLPEFRVAVGEPPFSHVGVDFFGPMQVKRGRSTVKRWGCIFTCLVVRAVHLEVVETLETDTFINSLERFMNRRGHPNLIVSDCGSNFRGADKELRACLKELDQEKIKTFAANRRVKWQFNPPNAPHMGGAWERLVRSVKKALKAILKGRLVDDFSLATIFTEAESIMNSRPLTATSDDINDLEALTPNHFLLGHASPNLPPGIFYGTDISNRKRWRQVQVLTEHIWRRFQREYLPTLTRRPKWRSSEATVQYGDLVLVQDQNSARGKWPLARIIKLFPGQDGRTRVAEVKTESGTYIRPVAKLHILEKAESLNASAVQDGEYVAVAARRTENKAD